MNPMNGRVVKVAKRALSDTQELLRARETFVLQMTRAGHTSAAIGFALSMNPASVRRIRKRLKDRLDTRARGCADGRSRDVG